MMKKNNRVVHFEIPTDYPETSMNFFKTIFGWEFQKYGDEDYWFAKTGDENTPGIDGAIIKKRNPDKIPVNSIDVENIDDTAKEIERAGGKIVVPKTPVPKMGWFCFFTDPDNNVLGLWQSDENAV